ncbi:hypothetical protein CRG98_026233 [Punica granatum]|uniref:Uncharacterized protein n=1 Tax=Punica granatum TaxID=22663 RepID=A0A2I0JBJ1_PUNGR|nr:hypothetical protein CRG98_026233 [Punica granatum]
MARLAIVVGRRKRRMNPTRSRGAPKRRFCTAAKRAAGENAYFSGSGSTWEIKMSSEKPSETCSLVLVVLGCVQACFRVPFTYPWIGHLESPVKKASTNVRECLGSSRRLLKCAWSPEGLDLSGAGLVTRVAVSLRMPWSCDEGLELWGRAPTYPEGSKIRVRRSSCVCCTYDPSIIRSHGDYKQCVNTGLDARPSGLLLALHGHIKTFSKVPKRFCVHPNFISSGHACTKPMQRGSGVSTFPGARDGRT